MAVLAFCSSMSAITMLRTAGRVGVRAVQPARRLPYLLAPQPIRSSRRFTTNATQTAADGDTVQVHYTGSLDNGEVFDSSLSRDPLEFVVGSGMVIKGFDVAVTGLAVGEKRTSRIEPEDAYGERREQLIARLPKERCPPGLEAGMMVELGNGLPATVTEVTDTEVEIDANHRLAGKALTFDVQLMGLTKGQ